VSWLFWTVKWIDAPGSLPVLGICALIAALLAFVWPRRRGVAAAWIGGVAAVYLLLALPVVAATITRELPAVHSPAFADQRPIDALVVFDGDNRRGRVIEARRIYNATHVARVWSLGWQPWMHDALAAAGIPPDRLIHDASPQTTRDQVAWVQHLATSVDPSRIVIVASRLQMPRIDALLSTSRRHVLVAASAVDTEPASEGPRAFEPTYFALRISRDALYEHMALIYYRWKGWIGRGV
jgi:uncharacterized SAM-binding protein YcdF (DUF218 family)